MEKTVVVPDEKHICSDDISSSSSQIESFAPSYDAHTDRLLTTKIDLKVIPILGLLYLICFLDRTNIANAKIAGLVTGLDMPSTG